MGQVFQGEFEDGDAVKGTMNFSNGDVYIGEWKNDSRHGRGKFISCETAEVQSGIWDDDTFLGSDSS